MACQLRRVVKPSKPFRVSSVYLSIVVMAAHGSYRFEPKRAQNLEENRDGDGEMSNLLETTDRCSCGLRQVLPTPSECIRCQTQPEWETKRIGH